MSIAKKEKATPIVLLGRPKGTLKMGLVGLPNVGKSTTFNFLSKLSVPAENYPFCTLEPNLARISVPDEHFDNLCKIYQPKSQVSATLSIMDIAGLVKGAHKGEGLGNSFLSHIQQVDGIFHVVRAFDEENIVHSEGAVNPVNDLQIIYDELRLKDLDRCQKLYDDMKKLVDRGQNKNLNVSFQMLQVFLDHLKDGNWISNKTDWSIKEVEALNDYCFLTAKPVIYLINMNVKDYLRKKNKYLLKIHEWVEKNMPGPIIPYSADYEKTLIENPDSLQEHVSAVQKIILTGYSTLQLIHFYTTGKDEVKCWTIREGTKAPQAAGVIHTDMEKGFICAEVTKYDDLIELGSEQAVKNAGKVATKGRDYIVRNRDIMFFKFNLAKNKK